ncbi:unnamed protein product [Calypogeia fissa]
MTLSETGTWLAHALQTLTSDGDSVLHLDPETLFSLVSYCEKAPPTDAEQYLLNIVGDDRCKDIVAEYLQRRGVTENAGDAGLRAYQKPRHEEPWSSGTKKTPKQKSGGGSEGPGNASTTQKDSDHKSPLYSGNGVLSAENVIQKGKRPVGKGKKGGKGISLAEASKGLVVFARSGPCDCQCTRHKLVNNCLSCGRIVCEQEGEGPCHFCGVLVLREGSDYGGLEGLPVPAATEAEVAAEEFKNRLVEYDRTAASRTTVIDDQSDYFEIEGNTWLTEKEKKLLQERLTDEERKEEERRKRVVVTIDLLGRKVVVAGQEDGKETGESFSVLGSEVLVGQDPPKVPRVKPNPFLMEAPVFIDSRQSITTDSSSAAGVKVSSARKSTELRRSGRIQHDDPIVEALIGHSPNDSGSIGAQKSHVWQSPKARLLGQAEEESSSNCEADMAVLQDPLRTSRNSGLSGRVQPTATCNHVSNNGSRATPFDICLPHSTGKSKPVVLSPSVLMVNQTKRKEAWRETNGENKQPNRVLLPGMILLKRWLSLEQQVDIVKYCRTVGIGPGGFYQPQFGHNSKMNLQMMCLGMHWEPTTKTYEIHRSHYDNALPPLIPDSFTRLVDKALLAARVAATQDSGEKSKRVQLDKHSPVPEMVPNVCIVNFYERSGTLGMHQDKDESSESLQKERPVVSFSIGDSAEFAYGKQSDLSNADNAVLESGDVLIFGGPSRMIYHGVTKVISETSPRWLSETANLRPGRLNLTFRQY